MDAGSLGRAQCSLLDAHKKDDPISEVPTCASIKGSPRQLDSLPEGLGVCGTRANVEGHASHRPRPNSLAACSATRTHKPPSHAMLCAQVMSMIEEGDSQ